MRNKTTVSDNKNMESLSKLSFWLKKDITFEFIYSEEEIENIEKTLKGSADFSLIKNKFDTFKINNALAGIRKNDDNFVDNLHKIIEKIKEQFEDEEISRDVLKQTGIFEIVKNFDRNVEKYIRNNVKVSVIIPVYNAAKTLEKSLNSCLNQTLKEIEIICVDDKSKDKSWSILEEYSNKDGRLKIVKASKNGGAGAARNIALQYANGVYLAFLDADDVFELDALETAYEQAEKYGAEICVFNALEKSVKTNYSRKTSSLLDEMQQQNPFTIQDIGLNPFVTFHGYVWDKLFLRDYVVENDFKFADIYVGEDACFAYPALLNADNIVACDKTLLTHFIDDTSQATNSIYDKNWKQEYEHFLILKNYITTDKEQKFFTSAILQSVFVVFNFYFKTDTAASEYFNLLVTKGFKELGIDQLTYNDIESEQIINFKFVERMKQYKKGEFAVFKADLNDKPIINDTETFEKFNIGYPTESKVVFLAPIEDGKNSGLKLFEFHALTGNWSDSYLVMEFLELSNHRKNCIDRLNFSLWCEPNEETPNVKDPGAKTYNITQAEWDNGFSTFMDNIVYTRFNNVYTFYFKEVERFSGISMKIIHLSSRDELNPTVKFFNQGLNGENDFVPHDAIPITDIVEKDNSFLAEKVEELLLKVDNLRGIL